MVAPSLVYAKCRTSAGMTAKVPGGMSCSAFMAKASPVAAENVPASTVRCSSVGCQCAAILYPAGNLARMVNGPAWDGSPESTATIAPLGSAGGGSPHLIWGSVIMTCAFGLAVGLCACDTDITPT